MGVAHPCMAGSCLSMATPRHNSQQYTAPDIRTEYKDPRPRLQCLQRNLVEYYLHASNTTPRNEGKMDGKQISFEPLSNQPDVHPKPLIPSQAPDD
jgi:hypothetical protein